MDEELLAGGNTHDSIVRIGDTVRRPTGLWTPGVHALLRHLESRGFEGCPRVLGVDEQGREVLTFVPGDVVYPDHVYLLSRDDALAEVARVIRSFHDAVADFDDRGYAWSDRGADGRPGGELVCHGDLAPWNLVHRPEGGWAFVDWDLAAPGSRSWDLAWALLTLVPLSPDVAVEDAGVARRMRVFRDAYGREAFPADVVEVAVARCRREAGLIATLGAAGEPPYDRLLAEGHHAVWAAAGDHVELHAPAWGAALASPSPARRGSA